MEALIGSQTFSPKRRGLISREEFLYIISNTPLATQTNNKKITYFNVPAAFDIETTSFYQGSKKQAVMYVWQFGIFNWVTYGRTWDEFISLLKVLSSILCLSEKNRLVVYCHNLPYEFQFMRKHIEWDKVFLLDKRKPVYAIYGGYEFRCSLKLSSKSLENVGKDLVRYKVEKAVGDLDYTKMRFSTTPLTEEELGYCELDIRVVLAYIQEKIENDNGIINIPLTNTGYVRNHCRKKCLGNYKKYRSLMLELTLDPDEYAQLKRAFAGGFTHACAKYVAEGKIKVLINLGSFDFTSSYPAVMLLEKFPMSKAILVDSCTLEEFESYLKNYCCLFDFTVENVRPKLNYDHPLSASKLILPKDKEAQRRIKAGWLIDNGRIVEADKLSATMTEQDWAIFNHFYTYDKKSLVIHKLRIYEKGYLPKEFYMSILDLYKEKTKLKDVVGEELNYMIKKNMLNAAYGMVVTDIVRDILEYDNDEGYLKPTKPDLEEAIDNYNKSIKRFMFYPWGVWVTAYARRNLFSGIMAAGDDYVYSDTDSIKILHPERHMDYINAYNEMIKEKIKAAAKHFRISEDEYSPKNIKGKPKTIGVWDYEGQYRRFKTLGAKRYMFERMPEDIDEEKGLRRYSITVAGVNKRKACEYLVKNFIDPFDGFNDGMRVPPDYSGRLTLTYIDEPCEGAALDYLGNLCYYHEETSIHMEPSEYNMELSAEYRSFMQFVYGIDEDSW